MLLLLATLALAEDAGPPATEAPPPPPPAMVAPPPAAEPVPVAAPAPAPAEPIEELLLIDGQVLRGAVTRTATGFVVDLGQGVTIDVPANAVRRALGPGESLAELRELPRPVPPPRPTADSSSGRSIVGPTAIPLGAGRGYVSQREIAATIVGVGITDGIDLTAGAVLPLLTNSYTRMAVVGTKLSVPVSTSVTTAVALEALFLFEDTWLTPHAMVTWHSPRAAYSLGGGATIRPLQGDNAGLVMASGAWRLGRQVSLLAETWVLSGDLPYGPATMLMPNIGARFHLGAWTLDAALVTFDPSFGTGQAPIPLPWFDATIDWGRPKDD